MAGRQRLTTRRSPTARRLLALAGAAILAAACSATPVSEARPTSLRDSIFSIAWSDRVCWACTY